MATTYEMAAIRAFLLANATVADLVGQRVYGNEIPDVEAALMPRKLILVLSAGGAYLSQANRSYMQVDARMKDVNCYGETPYEARKLWDAVNEALKGMRRHLRGDCLLYSAVKIGGPTSLREPDSKWPFTLSSYQVLAAETAA